MAQRRVVRLVAGACAWLLAQATLLPAGLLVRKRKGAAARCPVAGSVSAPRARADVDAALLCAFARATPVTRIPSPTRARARARR
jgi:hypothetical protein